MKILLREGSAARNFDELLSLLEDNWENCMFCSDDKHPDDLAKGHINLLVKRAIKNGIDPIKVLTAASYNPIKHYNLDIGLLQKGDSADVLIVDNLENINVLKTYIDGIEVAANGTSRIKKIKPDIINNFNIKSKKSEDFRIKCSGDKINVIEVLDGQLITEKQIVDPNFEDDYVVSNVEEDILKIVVINRYKETKPSIGFIKNFGLKNGAIASSVAHDSHNIICVGVTDEDICNAVNLIIENKGGICVVNDKKIILSLPIAGIISDKDHDWVSKKYTELDSFAKQLGSKLKAPFMSLSFMGLSVIPKIKLSDKGLFDSEKFEFISVCK
jgi:adenine deaminase